MVQRALMSFTVVTSALLFNAGAFAQSQTLIEEIQLLAIPDWGGDSTVPVGAHWSVFDFQDSVAIQVKLRHPSGELPRGMLFADMQYRVGRGVPLEDNPEVLDPDKTHEGATWLPSMMAVSIPLSESRRLSDDTFVVSVGFTRPSEIQRDIRSYNQRLVATDLRVKAVVICDDGESHGLANVHERLVRLHW